MRCFTISAPPLRARSTIASSLSFASSCVIGIPLTVVYDTSGTVKYVHYNAGRFFNAAAEKASLENEQMSVGIDTGRHRILVRQIAGLLARRLVTYSRDGEIVRQGDRMGLMKFSSRMDVFLPPGSAIRVREGQAVVAGVTPLAELPAP